MGEQNRRRDVRVPCDVPVRLLAHEGTDIEARAVDLSRSGLRVRIPGALLSLHRLASLASAASAISTRFGPALEAELNHRKLGPLLRRPMRPVRIAKRSWENADVELGCEFDVRLLAEEADLLGVVLPAPVSAPASRDATGPRLVGGGRRDLRAYIQASDERGTTALLTEACEITSGMALLSLPHPEEHAFAQLDVASAVVALHDMYGRPVTVRIVEGDEDVWVGPAEITEVDVLHGDDPRVSLGVAFGRPLRPDELSRLGLPTPA